MMLVDKGYTAYARGGSFAGPVHGCMSVTWMMLGPPRPCDTCLDGTSSRKLFKLAAQRMYALGLII
jgi:hypothetical protein